MATQKITINNGDTDYRAKLAAAQAHSVTNPYIQGLTEGMHAAADAGFGMASSASRHPIFGNTNITTGDALDGSRGNFKPAMDAAGGMVLSDPMNSTANLDAGVSSTLYPHTDPRQMGQAVEQRVQMMATGNQWQGMNNRQNLYQPGGGA